MLTFSSYTAVLFDMDGVIYRGQQPLPGVNELLALLESQGVFVACVTNNATMTPQQFEAKLAAMDIHIPAARIVTSPLATRRYLEQESPRGTTVYPIGMVGLRDALFADGYFVQEEQHPTYVVVGLDSDVTYAKFKAATLAIGRGARFIGTNPDLTLPTEEGNIPGAGSLLALLQAATGVSPTVIGKPAAAMFQAALSILGADPAHTLTVGDRLDTDIAGARAAQLDSALVLTGVTTPAELQQSELQPDGVFADLPALAAAWRNSL